nr:MmcQ/YjbR family DNA-binding protein [Photobacterium halotolerans]
MKRIIPVTYDEYNAFCRSLPATTYVVQWGGAHVWKVGGKVFAIGGWEKSGGPAYTFKASELNFNILKDEPGFRPAPYLASRGMKWIQQTDTASTKDEALRYYLKESYRIVSLGLSKKKQKELGLNQGE